MYNSASSAILTNVRFENNTVGTTGGGMYENNSHITLNGATFYGNHAGNAGGGIADEEQSSSKLNNVTFTMNNSNFGGGMYIDTYYPGQPPTLTNVIFIANSATSRGGGLYVYTSSPILTNVIFAANSALSPGGAIGNYGGHLTLTNVTFSNNSAPANGGGAIYNFGSPGYSSGTALFQNSLLWGDTGGEISNDAASASTATVNYSLVQGCNPGGAWISACGTDGGHNLADADPFFLDAFHARLQLTHNSPAIDAGNDVLVNPGETDVTGDSRITGAHVDLGAYEFSLLYVDSRATSGLNNGSSWADAYISLQTALSAATHDSEVWVAKGTYKPSESGNRWANFRLITGAMIYGGFAGTETTRSQ
jgi:predicted outer membrane repeat protein